MHTPQPLRVFVSTSWLNPHFDDHISALAAIPGLQVFNFRSTGGFDWQDIDPRWRDWTAQECIKALDHPLAQAEFDTDMGALERADVVVLLMPCGRSAHLELGYAVGAKKRTVYWTPDAGDPELMAKMCDLITDDFGLVCHTLQAWRDGH